MSQVREIKCPHCGEWTLWKGDIDDRCFFCDGFLEPRQFSREVEKKIRKEVIKEADFLFIRPGNGLLLRAIKRSLNYIRWWAFYVQIAFFVFVTLLLVILSIFTG